jgi:hypothetical protein
MSDEPVPHATGRGEIPAAFTITPREREVLRVLASRVAELAARPIEQEKRELWYRHNALEATRPLLFCSPENGWNEIITPEQLQCESELARGWEMRLRAEIYWGTVMCDDRVIEPFFDIAHVHTETDWGMHEIKIGGEEGGSYVWDAPFKDYAADLSRLRFPHYEIDYPATERLLDLARNTFGDLLTVRLKTFWFWTVGLTWTLITLRGMQPMMLDMIERPDDLHRLMAFLRDGHMARMDYLEQHNLLSLNNDGSYVGSGGFGWSRELPGANFEGRVRFRDVWGFAESQETVGVSPQMFAEFVLPYQLPLMERFGLLSYGCCEPLDRRWRYVEKLPRLRRVSVSPWSNINTMAEYLGPRYIFSMKPRPSDLVMPTFDEDMIRKYLRDAIAACRRNDCRMEIIMKDNHTIGNDPNRIVRWNRIAREEAEAW